MSTRKMLAAAGIVVSSALAFTACTPPTPSAQNTSAASSGGSATVAWNQAFFSHNEDTDYGNATANAIILYMANDRIGYYDDNLTLAQNPSFGTYEKISENPLKVKVTFADTATWSDGTPVTAADALLFWGATSGHYNTTELEQDEEGNVSDATGSDVFFNGSDPGFALITEFPEIGDDNKSITFTYAEPFVDWEIQASEPTTVPAHVVAKRALGISDAAAAQQALVDAFRSKDNAALSKIANVFNGDFNFKTMPADTELVVGNGPYVITDLREEQFVTLEKNPNYKGEHTPTLDKITVRVTPDPQASVQALQNGEVLVTQPQSTADILQQLQGMENVSVLTESGSTYEHVDLVFANGGPFDPATYGGDAEKAKLVRQAFLHALPRQQIIDNIIKPLNPRAEIRETYTVVPGSPNYDDMVEANGARETYGGGSNVDKARELLTEAGVTNPTVRMMFGQNNTRRQQQFQLVKEQTERAGFTIVDVSSNDWGQLLSQPSVYDASMFGWNSTSTGAAESVANFVTGGQNNYGKYSNAEVDRLLNELNVTADPARQKAILEEVEKHLVDDAFGLPIYQHPEITGISSNIKNVSSIPLSPSYFWNVWEWTVS